MTLDFPEFHGEHDESIHDYDDEESHPLADRFGGMSKDEMAGHFKDIIRGFSDKGVEATDKDGDGYLDVEEIVDFINNKMGYAIKVSPSYVIYHYDVDQDNKLSKDEVWRIIESKDPAIFKVLPEVMEKNVLLMHGMKQEHVEEEEPIVNEYGFVIRY